jgi:hypothetical protein
LWPLRAPIICLSTPNRQMGTGMKTTQPATPTLVQGPVSIARQHGEACFHCGAVAKKLYADGCITLVGTDRVWPIVTCGCRRQAVAS